MLFFNYGRVNGYGGRQIWYGLKAYPSGRRLPKTRSPADKNLANKSSLSTHRENRGMLKACRESFVFRKFFRCYFSITAGVMATAADKLGMG